MSSQWLKDLGQGLRPAGPRVYPRDHLTCKGVRMVGVSTVTADALEYYREAITRARENYRIMTVDPWLHYIAVKREYDRAKAEADLTYTIELLNAFAILAERVGKKEAERINRYVHRTKLRDDR